MLRLTGTFVLLALATACAVGPGFQEVQPEDIPALEQAVLEEEANAEVHARLGIAYGRAERLDESRAALERAVAMPDPPVAAWAYLGALYEQLDEAELALEAYRRYMAEGARPARSTVEGRIEVLTREVLRREARAAVAMEAELMTVTPDRATVGVMPLIVQGPEEYQALGVGLADLLTTDLSITDRIQVLERAQLVALMEETRLQLGGYTDHASAARAGRLLRAGRLVQGQVAIEGEGLHTELVALVVDAMEAAPEGGASTSGAFERLMELQTELALAIYEELGIELTPAERARIEDKPTRNIHAFLAYSEGLQLMDHGDFAGAAARFNAAATLDPGFTAAAQAAGRASVAEGADVEGVTQEVAADVGEPAAEPVAESGGGVESMVDAAVPAGTTATATGGAEAGSGSSDATKTQNTEATTGTRRIPVPIILVRPRP